jgi:CHASE2 domain-containing sensor protein
MSTSSSGISFSGMLAIVFIALKLTGFISWSWLWVLSPLWIPLVFVAFILLVIAGWAIYRASRPTWKQRRSR